jgi:hypothetical protein
VHGIVDAPGNASATVAALTAAASGAVPVKTTAPMTCDDADPAVKNSPACRTPGR